MIGAVSSFFPTAISRSLPSAQRTAPVEQQNAIVQPLAAARDTAPVSRASFADKLPSLLSLSPSDFSAIFNTANVTSFFAALGPQAVSASYMQSNLLTASKLSVQV